MRVVSPFSHPFVNLVEWWLFCNMQVFSRICNNQQHWIERMQVINVNFSRQIQPIIYYFLLGETLYHIILIKLPSKHMQVSTSTKERVVANWNSLVIIISLTLTWLQQTSSQFQRSVPFRTNAVKLQCSTCSVLISFISRTKINMYEIFMRDE